MEQVQEMGKLNELIVKETKRENGTTRIQISFENCISKTDQSQIDSTDVNKLIARHSPQELDLFLSMRNAHRQEIVGQDFSKEPDLQTAMNEVYRLKQIFSELEPDLKQQFKNVKEFVTFVDNPDNAEKLVKLGLLTKKQVEDVQQTAEKTPSKPAEPPAQQ